MTVQELITQLEKAQDKTQSVEVIWDGINCGEVTKVLQVNGKKLVYLQTVIPLSE